MGGGRGYGGEDVRGEEEEWWVGLGGLQWSSATPERAAAARMVAVAVGGGGG